MIPYQAETSICNSRKTREIIQGKSKCLGLETAICSSMENVGNNVPNVILSGIIKDHN